MSNTRGTSFDLVILSNNRLEKVPFVSVLHTSSSRLLLSNQDKGCTPSVAHSLPLPLGPALLNLSTVRITNAKVSDSLNLRSKIRERLNIGKFLIILGVQVLPENVILCVFFFFPFFLSFNVYSVIQKPAILECENVLVIFNARVTVRHVNAQSRICNFAVLQERRLCVSNLIFRLLEVQKKRKAE